MYSREATLIIILQEAQISLRLWWKVFLFGVRAGSELNTVQVVYGYGEDADVCI